MGKGHCGFLFVSYGNVLKLTVRMDAQLCE